MVGIVQTHNGHELSGGVFDFVTGILGTKAGSASGSASFDAAVAAELERSKAKAQSKTAIFLVVGGALVASIALYAVLRK